MQIHELTKKIKVEEGLLSGVKDSISSMGTNLKIGLGLGSPTQLAMARAKQNNAIAAKAAAKLAKKGYNVTAGQPTSPINIAQAANQSMLAPLQYYLKNIDTAEVQKLSQEFISQASKKSRAPYQGRRRLPVASTVANANSSPKVTAQSVDLGTLPSDAERKQQQGASALAQIKQTQAANTAIAQKDNQRRAAVDAIKAKQAAGQLITSDERGTLNLARRDGILEDHYFDLIETRLIQAFKQFSKGHTTCQK